MKKRNPARLELVYYDWKAIKVDSLASKREHRAVMQLSVMLNDLDSITYLDDLLVQKEIEHQQNKISAFWPTKWLEGVRLYLLRQNILVLFEGIKTLDFITEKVNKITAPKKSNKINKNPPLLGELITRNEKLLLLLQKLNGYLRVSDSENVETTSKARKPTKSNQKIIKHTPLYRSMAFVRNQLSGHADEKAINAGIKYLIQSGFDEGIVTKRTVTKRPGLARFRAFFIDDIVSHAWKRNVKIALEYQYKVAPKDEATIWRNYSALINEVKTLAAGFAYLLLVSYIGEHNLKVSKEREDIIEAQIKAF
jgi:hypothetical protein